MSTETFQTQHPDGLTVPSPDRRLIDFDGPRCPSCGKHRKHLDEEGGRHYPDCPRFKRPEPVASGRWVWLSTETVELVRAGGLDEFEVDVVLDDLAEAVKQEPHQCAASCPVCFARHPRRGPVPPIVFDFTNNNTVTDSRPAHTVGDDRTVPDIAGRDVSCPGCHSTPCVCVTQSVYVPPDSPPAAERARANNIRPWLREHGVEL